MDDVIELPVLSCDWLSAKSRAVMSSVFAALPDDENFDVNDTREDEPAPKELLFGYYTLLTPYQPGNFHIRVECHRSDRRSFRMICPGPACLVAQPTFSAIGGRRYVTSLGCCSFAL